MKIKKVLCVLLATVCISSFAGCSMIESKINDLKGNLVGNSYNITTYDNYGENVLDIYGEKINIVGNKTESIGYDSDGNKIKQYDLSSVITINIDGNQIQSCGDTCIFAQEGINEEINFLETEINSYDTGEIDNNTYISGIVNKYKDMFGKQRIVVIKSQLGQPITAYSGDDVYWEIPDDLPKMTKIMIDGKALYIHRANFQIIDKACLD